MVVLMAFPKKRSSVADLSPSFSALAAAVRGIDVSELLKPSLKELHAAITTLDGYLAAIREIISALPAGSKREQFERQRIEIVLKIYNARRLLAGFDRSG